MTVVWRLFCWNQCTTVTKYTPCIPINQPTVRTEVNKPQQQWHCSNGVFKCNNTVRYVRNWQRDMTMRSPCKRFKITCCAEVSHSAFSKALKYFKHVIWNLYSHMGKCHVSEGTFSTRDQWKHLVWWYAVKYIYIQTAARDAFDFNNPVTLSLAQPTRQTPNLNPSSDVWRNSKVIIMMFA